MVNRHSPLRQSPYTTATRLKYGEARRFVSNMSFLLIGSTGDHAGHSLLTWAIARRLVEKGFSVGFMKPFGTQPIHVEGLLTDRDVFLFREVLNLKEPFDRICPYPDSDEAWRQKGTEKVLDEFKSLAQELSAGKDILLIMGSKHIFFDDTSSPVTDVSLVTELKADFILVDRYRDTSRSIYSILSISSLLEDRIKGIIINRVPPERLEDIRERVIPSLTQKGIPVTSALPEDPVLSFRSLQEIRETLDGTVLWGEENLGKPVGGMTVGSGDLRGELMLFKRAYNKIILLETFSPDTETEETPAHRPIAGILLTGGRNPAPQLLEAAKKARVPLMLVKDDTFGAQERLERTTPSLSPKDEVKVHHFTELMDRDGGLDRVLRSLGLMPS